MTCKTTSRLAAISTGVSPPTFNRTSGSVFDARTMKCHVG